MCGRYRLTKAELYAEINDLRVVPDWTSLPRYNIAPTQDVAVTPLVSTNR
jgi:putative SOS response-associated peptidase YedK